MTDLAEQRLRGPHDENSRCRNNNLRVQKIEVGNFQTRRDTAVGQAERSRFLNMRSRACQNYRYRCS